MRATAFLLLLVLPALAGCADEPFVAGASRSLLHRAPDRVEEEPGVLAPTPEKGFGARARSGLGARPVELDGALFVPVPSGRCGLALPALTGGERTLEVRAALAGEAARGALELAVRLNGAEVGRLTTGPDAGRLRCGGWVAGENTLELSSPEGRGFGLAEVTYGRPARVELEPTGMRGAPLLRLDPGAAATWLVESRGPARLVLLGEGEGEVSLAIGERAATSSSSAGRVTAELLLPPADGPVAARLSWSAESAMPLRLSVLALETERPTSPPPILFVSIDTLAARHLPLFGYGRETAPTLERLAAESIVFERCWSNAPWTVPSYLSQLSGLYPGAHTLDPPLDAKGRPKPTHALQSWEKHRLSPACFSLAERLRAGGYRTAAFWENPWFEVDALGLGRGFDTWRGPEDGPGLPGRAVDGLAWLEELGDAAQTEPWFLLLQSTEPHGPYAARSPHRGAFSDGLDLSETRPVAPPGSSLFGSIPHAIARGAVPDGALPDSLPVEPLRAAYDEEILSMDAALDELLERLRGRGLLDRAIVIFSADHGESMTQHDFLFGHGVLYEENLHVPLLIRLPWGTGGGMRVAEPVQLVDLFPTLLAVADLAPDERLHGRSLAGLFDGVELRAQAVFAEGGAQTQSSVIDGRWKLIESRPWTAPPEAAMAHPALSEDARERVRARLDEERRAATREGGRLAESAAIARLVEEELGGPRYELFDLRADPDELREVSAEHPDVAARLRARLEREQARGQAARVTDAAAGAVLDPALLEELERIGYAGGAVR
ncbi:MAG: sulfatase [Planctomycetota bacterium]